MFKKFLSNFFGPKKETEKLENKTQFKYSPNKTEQERPKKPKLINNKLLKDKGFVNEGFEHFPDAKIVSKKRNTDKKQKSIQNSSSENYKELLGMFEKIEKTDGIFETKVKLSKSTTQIVQKWENALNNLNKEHQSATKEIIDVVIGFDFGTSSSKIVVNFPFNGDIDTYAFPVPKELRADNHEHCWKSILFYDKASDYFDVIPSSENMIQLSEIKTSLMNTFSNKIILENKGLQWTSEHISVIYLGILLKLIKGWVISDIVPKYYKNLNNIEYSWELNIGLPAAKLNEDKIIGKYTKIIHYAWIISNTNEKIKMTNYLSFFANQTQTKPDFLNIRPEVAAQSFGYIQSAMLDYGAYTVVDIGASTLDICVFNYVNIDDNEKQALFTANVDLLGAESINWIKIVNKQFNKKFLENDLQACIQSSFHTTLINTKTTRAATLREWDTIMPVIICGGGKSSDLHLNALNSCKKIWNNIAGGMIGNLSFINTSLPENLKVQCKKNQYHRLSVAWGLSIQQDLFAKVELPTDIQDLPKKKSIDITDRYIGPEHI